MDRARLVASEREYEAAEAAFLVAASEGGALHQIAELGLSAASVAGGLNSAAYELLHASHGERRAELDLLTERTEVLAELWRDTPLAET